MSLYSYKQVDALIAKYVDKGGETLQLEEGTLGSGDWLLYDYSGSLKFIVIKEVYLNCWCSAHTIRKYNKIPKKYEKILSDHGC